MPGERPRGFGALAGVPSRGKSVTKLRRTLAAVSFSGESGHSQGSLYSATTPRPDELACTEQHLGRVLIRRCEELLLDSLTLLIGQPAPGGVELEEEVVYVLGWQFLFLCLLLPGSGLSHTLPADYFAAAISCSGQSTRKSEPASGASKSAQW